MDVIIFNCRVLYNYRVCRLCIIVIAKIICNFEQWHCKLIHIRLIIVFKYWFNRYIDGVFKYWYEKYQSLIDLINLRWAIILDLSKVRGSSTVINHFHPCILSAPLCRSTSSYSVIVRWFLRQLVTFTWNLNPKSYCKKETLRYLSLFNLFLRFDQTALHENIPF